VASRFLAQLAEQASTVKIDYRLNPNANEFARTKDNPKLIHHYQSLPVTEWFFSTIRTFDKKTNNLGNTI